jgi:hypothetical protein
MVAHAAIAGRATEDQMVRRQKIAATDDRRATSECYTNWKNAEATAACRRVCFHAPKCEPGGHW